MYPAIGHPPYNCDFCGGRVKGDHCHRHEPARLDRVRLIDKYLGMRVLRNLTTFAMTGKSRGTEA